jgi:eukaryotic translation initiation factor 2C
LTDRNYGLNSICLAKPEATESSKNFGKYMTNIAQKINFKTGGINSSVKDIGGLLGGSTLILGADVVHPGMKAYEESPSIACIVGSVDN